VIVVNDGDQLGDSGHEVIALVYRLRPGARAAVLDLGLIGSAKGADPGGGTVRTLR